MFLKMIMGAMMACFIAGCSTTQRPSNVSQLQIRVARIEQKLEQRDQDVMELRYSVEELSSNLAKERRAVKVVQNSSRTIPEVLEKVLGSTPQEILRVPIAPREVQRALKSAGYYDGAIDGHLGSSSQCAIEKFQKEHDLESDGIVGKKTWKELKEYLE